ncbi:MAG TPA: RHS repeat-associated core domain-containing protein [Solirubrobacterales bacterium]|nr:RHS repeat-associated core domain-containing protein [Solirubrobacterales bacterium]
MGVILLLVLPGGAAAAECTDTWTGPAEGSWTSASSWSAGHVPGASDVVCISSGSTVKMTAAGLNSVEGIQGNGTLVLRESTFKVLGTSESWWIGSLGMDYEGNLTGPSTVEVRSSLVWEAQSTMSGAGKTILGPSSTTVLANANSNFTVSSRTVVNEGALTQPNYGTLLEVEGGVFENLGTYTLNGEKSLWQVRSEGTGSTFINRGFFRKTEGPGAARIASNFENAGRMKAAAGQIKLEGERAVAFADGSQLEGSIACEKPSVTLGALSSPEVELSFREDQVTVPAGKTASLGVLRMDYHGNIIGPGTLEVTKALHWEGESSMSGGGKTILAASSVNTFGSGNVWYTVSARTLVNEGTVSQASYGTLREIEGGVFENLGTYTLNGEKSLWQVLSADPGSTFVNKGTFQKTEGTGVMKLSTSFENQGTIDIASGEARFEELNHSVTFADESHLEGAIVCEKATVVLDSFTAPNAQLSFREVPITIPAGKTVSIGRFTMRYQGNLTGAGTLEVTKSLDWAGESTMSGTGKTVLKPGTANVLDSGATTVTLSQRTLVNEGTFTQTESSRFNLNGGGTFKNRGTFNLNPEPYPTWVPQVVRNEGGGTGRFVNSGQVQRTEGSLDVKVAPAFENQGVLSPKSSKIEIEHPESLSESEKKGCSTAGDPVSCATGNFTESQTDLAIGGRGVGLVLTRSYSAQAAAAATAPGPFGYGWTGSFADHLTLEEGGAKVTLTRGDGSTIPFSQVSGSTYAAPAWSQETLSGTPEAGYTFTALDQTQYRFSGAGRLESITDRNGNQTSLAYEGARLKTVTDPAGRQLTFAYNAGGQVESVTDPMGHVVKYAYTSGNLISVTLPGETTPRWQFAYDTSHRITQITDGRGGKTTNEYDSSNRVVSQTDPAGRTLTFSYGGFHTTITNKATGAVTDEWFTSDNEPFSVTHGFGTPQATTETFTYDEGGRLLTRTDGLGHTTTYGYDEVGDRTSEKDPLGHESKWSFNATHDLISATTPRGETTTIKRDSHGNVESISRPAPGGATQTTSFKYGPHGDLESLTDPLSRTWTYGYDSYGDRTSETDPLGQKQTLAYDKDSRLTAIVSPRGNATGAKASEYETKVERDPQGRPVNVIDPLSHSTSYTYDGNGNLASVTDAATHTTKYTYNADDERTKVERPNGATLQTGYDGAGYVTSQTDGNGKVTTYVRNVLEQPVEVFDPLSRKTNESFDAAGELAKLTDPSGREATYSYDVAGRLSGVNYSDPATPDASFEYDADGNLTAMQDGTGKSTFAYDQLGRLTRSQDGHGAVVEYSYDLGEQQTGITYPNGKAVSRSYDAAGRLESVTDWLGGKSTFAYDADSNLKNIAFPSASGNLDEYTYNRASQMSEARFKKGAETLASLTYTRDALGQVEKEARSGLPGPAEISFGYDANNRLIKAGSSTYAYDSADNLTSGMGSSNTYDAASELEKGTGASYTYDKEGERTSATSNLAQGPAFLRQFGGTGSGPGNLSAPLDTATDSEGNVWVADSGHNRVQEFNSKGEFVSQFGATGTGTGQFTQMHALTFDAKGNLWVAAANRVQEFNAKGEYIRQFGTLGGGNGQFSEGLSGLAVDPEGHIWTLESSSEFLNKARLQEFSSEGAYLAKFEYVIGKEPGQLKSPQALAIDAAGNFWIADTANNRIEEFNAKGEYLRTSGSEGTGNGQFRSPKGIATDSAGNLWISDTGNNRIEELSSAGAYLAQFGKSGGNSGQFSEPKGLALDSKGNLWVADAANDRVEEWQTESTTTYGYDQAGNLTSIQRPEAGASPAIAETLAYDATGLLASKTSGLATKYMAWDASSPLPLLLNDGENSYIYGPNGQPIEQINSAEEPTYLHHDQLGSTRLLTNASGKTSASFSYAPYGGLEGKTGTATTPLGFAGQYTDAESGLQYLRARFYDSETGQFLSRDPIGALTGQQYTYGLDNPLTQVDPSGLFAIAGTLGCLAGPEVAAVCAGIGTTVACAAISPCRHAAEETAGDVASLFEGEDSGDESSSQDAEICKEIGDARQALDLAEQFWNKVLSTTNGGPPGGSRGRALLAVILIVINAIRQSG